MAKGHFGPAIIGDDAFEKEQEFVREHKGLYGPAVLDPHPIEYETVAQAQKLAHEGASNEPGPAVQESDPVEAYMMSARDATKLLAANPLEVDNLFRAELARDDGLRKSVLQALIKAENERPGPDGSKAPRAEVLETIEHAIASLEG